MAVITVSREYGSHGENIAQQVAQRLGYAYFDKGILADVANIADMTEEQIRRYDEKDQHGLRRFLRKIFVTDPHFVHYPHYPGLDWSPDEIEPVLEEDKVIAFFHDVVEKLWERGNVVIVGRGSQKILAAKPDTFHVRFIGRVIDRTEWIKDDEDMTYPDALEKMQTIDKQRTHYLKHHYEIDGGDPKHYHLVINTSLMTSEQAVESIITTVCNSEVKERGDEDR